MRREHTPRGFVVALREGRRCPVALCEDCGAEITDANHAGVVWRLNGGPPYARQLLRIVCKRCLSAYQSPWWGWYPLRLVLLQLLDNVGIEEEDRRMRDGDRMLS